MGLAHLLLASDGVGRIGGSVRLCGVTGTVLDPGSFLVLGTSLGEVFGCDAFVTGAAGP